MHHLLQWILPHERFDGFFDELLSQYLEPQLLGVWLGFNSTQAADPVSFSTAFEGGNNL